MLDVTKLLSGDFLITAVDPGMSGAVALLGQGTVTVLRDFKNLKQLAQAVAGMARHSLFTIIEQVHAMPGQGVCSMFSFGKSTGAAFGACYAALLNHAHPMQASGEVVEVSPQKWQNFYRRELDIGKGQIFDSRVIAEGLLPTYAPLFARKKDHGSADAILIGLWFLANRNSV